jgi:hypothetical protein
VAFLFAAGRCSIKEFGYDLLTGQALAGPSFWQPFHLGESGWQVMTGYLPGCEAARRWDLDAPPGRKYWLVIRRPRAHLHESGDRHRRSAPQRSWGYGRGRVR